MKAAIMVVYCVMATWLLLAAGIRITLQLRSGSDLDPLPFVSGAFGLIALVLLLPAYDEWRNRY